MLITIEEAIDTIFSHNSVVGIWKDCNDHESELVWSGMAHQIPEEYLNEVDWRIFGTVAESIADSDRINIRLAQ